MEGGIEIDADDFFPFGDRKILDRRDMLDPGIVDQDIDRSEGRFGLVDHCGNGLAIQHIGWAIAHFHAEFLGQSVGQLGNFACIPQAVQRDIDTLFGQRTRHRQTNSRSGTGDHCIFGLKRHQTVSMSRVIILRHNEPIEIKLP